MPISTTLRKLLCCAPGRQEEEEAEAPARRPLPVPVADEPVQPGRPHRDFVESETERYWQEMVKVGSLTKPNQQEIRAGATPVLIQALRNRPGWKLNPALNRAHMAANAVQLHLVKSGQLKHPFTPIETSPNYVEALIQLGYDAGWGYREIPLPDCQEPRHPPIHYTIDPITKKPIPAEDALLRGDYVYTSGGERLTMADYLLPWRGTAAGPSLRVLCSMYPHMYYSLEKAGNTVQIMFHWPIFTYRNPEVRILSLPISAMQWAPEPVADRSVQPGRSYRDHVENETDRYRQEMMDAGQQPREIPLPDHPAPYHPAIYYTLDPATGRPMPTEDSWIRGDYLYTSGGVRLSEVKYILPWRNTAAWPSLKDLRFIHPIMYYSLEKAGDTVQIIFHWEVYSFSGPLSRVLNLPINALHFASRPPPIER